MSDLAEFLRARLDEDEARQIPKAAGSSWGWHTSGCGYVMVDSVAADHCACGVPARVLAEVAAKRALIDMSTPTWLLRTLAGPYAEHPDFDPAWRI